MPGNLIFVLLLLLSLGGCSDDLGYEPSIDPYSKLDNAAVLARQENKLILIVSGGDWCRWCHILNNYLNTNKDIHNQLKKTFVVVKIYRGDKNYNEEFFSSLPKSIGVPHFWVMSNERKALGSQDTGALENGVDGYDNEKFLSFIVYWEKYRANNKKGHKRE